MRIFILALCILSAGMAYAQRTITGTVTNDQGTPLPGVSVKIYGTSVGTTTDLNGQYRISIPDDYVTLVFSGEGLARQETAVGAREVIDIQMKATTVPSTEDGVSLGYGTVSKDKLTGNVSQVSGEAIRDNPVSNLEASMQGRTPGVLVKSTGVQVRGSASLTASNEPLYVVDGVPLASGSHNSINPANIKSMEILKDASAAAIYGTRAANGVIVITTHSGRSGKMQLDVDYQVGIATTPKFLDLMGPDEFNRLILEYRLRQLGLGQYVDRTNLFVWQSALNDGEQIQIGNVILNEIGTFYDSLQYSTDWQKRVFRAGLQQRATVSAQGGTEKLGYYVSTVYQNQEGILIGQQNKTINSLLSLDGKITSKLSANASLNFIHGIDDRLREDQDLGAPLQAIALPSSDAPDASNRQYLEVFKLLYNPETEINNSTNRGTSNAWIGSLGLTYQFLDNLSLDVATGIDHSSSRDVLRMNGATRDGGGTYLANGSGRSELGTSQIRNYLVNGWFTYTPAIGDNHSLTTVLGASYEQSKSEFTFRTANVPSIRTLEGLADDDPLLQEISVPGGASVFVSNFARVNYGFKNRYLVQLTARRDGSSRFPEANRFGTFLAVSGGWVMSEEPFFPSEGLIRYLKFKGSYGQIGNTPLGDFEYQKNYVQIQYGGNAGFRLINPENPDLRWETTTQTNVGMEFSLGSRISGSVDYYVKNTTDLLFPKTVSPTSGFSQVTRNGGSMRNSGVEIGISTQNVNLPDWQWSTDFNITFARNTITDLEGERLIVGTNAFLEGHPASAFYLRKYVGVDPDTGNAQYDDGNGGVTTDWESAPRMVVGNPNPGYFGGITNNVSHKRFELSFMIQFVGDVDRYFATGEFLENSGILGLNQLSTQVDRWYQPGDNAPYPRVNPFKTDTEQSTRWLEDGSYARLTNLTLTYRLPDELLQRWKLRSAEVYVGGQNLLTWTKYSGYDPDVVYVDPTTGTLGQNINRGVDNFTPPQPRIITTGIKLGL